MLTFKALSIFSPLCTSKAFKYGKLLIVYGMDRYQTVYVQWGLFINHYETPCIMPLCNHSYSLTSFQILSFLGRLLIRLFPIKCPLPAKIVFQHRISSVKGPLTANVVFQQRSSFIFHQCLSSIKGYLPPKIVFH